MHTVEKLCIDFIYFSHQNKFSFIFSVFHGLFDVSGERKRNCFVLEVFFLASFGPERTHAFSNICYVGLTHLLRLGRVILENPEASNGLESPGENQERPGRV